MRSAAHYREALAKNPALEQGLHLKWSKFIPHAPTPRQHAFLMLPQREVFYGGSAGGGKSDALLMAALQYVDVPSYSAIIFRKSFADLRLAGALIDRSLEWLSGTEAKWSGQQHEWNFPSGAKLAFGNLDHETRKFRYQSAEFQYIAFDELSQFFENDYLYLFSRLRRLSNSTIPLRMRAASNPGGVGHLWVKERFEIREDPATPKLYRGHRLDRPFIPAFIKDNPYLDQEEYKTSLSNLDPVTREQLLHGDWSVSADGRFKKDWFKYFSDRYDHWTLGRGAAGELVRKTKCAIFSICDPAASAQEGPGLDNTRKAQPSSTVIGTFAVTPKYDLLVLDIRRIQVEIPDIFKELHDVYNTWHPVTIGIEAAGVGIGVFQGASRQGLPIEKLMPNSGDKLVRATESCNRAEQGKIYLPEAAPWLHTFEAEIFTWTANPKEPDDQVDVLAYAGTKVSRMSREGNEWSVGYIRSEDELPSTVYETGF